MNRAWVLLLAGFLAGAPVPTNPQTKASVEAGVKWSKGASGAAKWLNDGAVRSAVEKRLAELMLLIDKDLKPGTAGVAVEVLVRKSAEGVRTLGCVRYLGSGASVNAVLSASFKSPTLSDCGNAKVFVSGRDSKFLWYVREGTTIQQYETPDYCQTRVNAGGKCVAVTH
jgi:hypothetical protein